MRNGGACVQVADRCLGDHQGVKGILARLDTMIVTDPSFDMLLGQAMTVPSRRLGVFNGSCSVAHNLTFGCRHAGGVKTAGPCVGLL
jgi:hypothetical protein